MIDLLQLQPHKVSMCLNDYFFLFYGREKTGKTTIASEFESPLLLATEKGYNAIDGIYALPVNKWSEFLKIVKQLESPQVKEKFKTIIVDTGDLLYDMCVEYVCSNAGVDSLSDVAYGNGYNLVEKEFEKPLHKITKLGYGFVCISHEKDKVFKPEKGGEYHRTVPSIDKKGCEVLSRMCDIIGYARDMIDEKGNSSVKLFMRGTPSFVAGSRFRYIAPVIDFNYSSLSEAVKNAIEEQRKRSKNGELFINKSEKINDEEILDYDILIMEFNDIVGSLIKSTDEKTFLEVWNPKILQVVEKYLGKGKKVNSCSREQVEVLDLIVTELKDIVRKEKEKESAQKEKPVVKENTEIKEEKEVKESKEEEKNKQE